MATRRFIREALIAFLISLIEIAEIRVGSGRWNIYAVARGEL